MKYALTIALALISLSAWSQDFVGTSGDDVLVGTFGDDTFQGGDGTERDTAEEVEAYIKERVPEL